MFWYSIRFINARSRSNYGNQRIPESVKLLLVESGIPEHFVCGIRGRHPFKPKLPENLGPKLKGSFRSNRKSFEKTGPFPVGPVGILVEWIAPRNTAQGIRNPTKDWNPESKFHWQKLESSTWNPESTAWKSRIQDCLRSQFLAPVVNSCHCCFFIDTLAYCFYYLNTIINIGMNAV